MLYVCLVCGPQSQCENGVLNNATCRCDCPEYFWGLRCERTNSTYFMYNLRVILFPLRLWLFVYYGSTLSRLTIVGRSSMFYHCIIFTAMHTMQDGISRERNVCMSVCLSVKRVNSDKTKETYIYTI